MGEVKWRRVNSEPVEYAIQQGPHGDEFVKLLDGSCLLRTIGEVDLVDQLRNAARDALLERTVPTERVILLNKAADEIECLRSLTGAVTTGESFKDIKDRARPGFTGL